MRPRFSLRWLLLALTVFALGLYVLFVHPTVRAQQLVAAINRGDYQTLIDLKMQQAMQQSYDRAYAFENCDTTAELTPRTWPNVYKCCRNVVVHVKFPSGGTARPSGVDFYVTVHLNGQKWGKDN
jgi:hypothetical protein